MSTMTEREWEGVLDALCRGGLRAYLDSLLLDRASAPGDILLSADNRRIIEQAYDDGDGGNVVLVPTEDTPWFAGMYEDSEVLLGMEHEGTLYSVVHASGGGLCSVIVGRGLIENEMGIAFHGAGEAKAYVKGLISK